MSEEASSLHTAILPIGPSVYVVLANAKSQPRPWSTRFEFALTSSWSIQDRVRWQFAGAMAQVVEITTIVLNA
jgi:hypothetical protein